MGRVKKDAWPSDTDKRKADNENLYLVVRFTSTMTDGALNAVLAQELSVEKYGREEGWVLLQTAQELPEINEQPAIARQQPET